MAPVRLRHSKGVSTIQVAFDKDDYTVQDLQQEIYAVTDILPSRQDLKKGYPPQSMTLVPELPFSSLGLKPGEQIIVGQNAGPSVSKRNPESNGGPVSSRSGNNATAIYPSVPMPPVQTLPKPSVPSQDHVEAEGGVLVHRVVPDDNSCLFTSIALIFQQDMAKSQQMRQIAADGIKADPSTYSKAILGQPPAEYISTILKPSTWGGAIELSLFATHFNTEIASIDVETGRIDHFQPKSGGNGELMRCVLIYSGIHYDAATLAPMADAPMEWHQSLFPIRPAQDDEKDPIIIALKKLADILRRKKAFTNTSTFDLKCEDCGEGLKGEKGAREHAAKTGHARFGEYRND